MIIGNDCNSMRCNTKMLIEVKPKVVQVHHVELPSCIENEGQTNQTRPERARATLLEHPQLCRGPTCFLNISYGGPFVAVAVATKDSNGKSTL